MPSEAFQPKYILSGIGIVIISPCFKSTSVYILG
nr:MAG TPA: hypothetical protein [Caudoviricetes sp.]